MRHSGQKSVAAAIGKGRRLQVEGRYEENFEFLEEAVQRFPTDPEIRLLYATSLLAVRPDDAVCEATKAIDLDPDEPIRLTRAASLLFHMGEIDGARSYATHAAELTPSGFLFTPDLAHLGGLLAVHDENNELAEEAFRGAVEAEPGRDVFVRDLAKFLAERGRAKEALEIIDQALKVTKEGEKIERLRGEIAGNAPSGSE